MAKLQYEKGAVWVAILTVSMILLFFSSPAQSNPPGSSDKETRAAIPRMLDLGRNQCLPCKMMAPVLEELKREYAGVIDIAYINVTDKPEVMKGLGLALRAVPFQIFYDALGKIVKRHYGYMSKEEILQTFEELGFDRKPASAKQ